MKANRHSWKARLACLMMVWVCMCGTAGADTIFLDGVSVWDAYDEMKIAFELGKYDEAAKWIDDYQLAEKNFNDAKQYRQYCLAWANMAEENYGEAAMLLQGLKNTNAKFYDCEAFYFYACGRQAQQQEKYEAAIEFYVQAASFQDASERSVECGKLLEQKRRKQAMEYYQKGIEERDENALQQAKEGFELLEDAQNAAVCAEEIRKIQDERALENAILSYQTALSQKNVDLLQESYRFFSARTDERSRKLSQECLLEINKINRSVSAAVVDSAADALQVHISDTLQSEKGYTILYAPVNNADVEQMHTDGPVVWIRGLLPNTEYALRIVTGDANEQEIVLTGKTKAAQAYAENHFTLRSKRLLGIKDAYLRDMSVLELWSIHPNIPTLYEEYTLELEETILSLSSDSYYYLFSAVMDQSVEEAVTLRWVLRSKENGLVIGEEEQRSRLAKEEHFVIELDAMLDQLYENANGWPSSPCVLELYINQQLAGSGVLNIVKK